MVIMNCFLNILLIFILEGYLCRYNNDDLIVYVELYVFIMILCFYN